MNISVFGLGKMGLCTAAAFAAAGHMVKGYDVSSETINNLNAGKIIIQEPQLDSLLAEAKTNISFHTDPFDALNETQVTLIIVPTPSDETGRFSNQYIISTLNTIGPWMGEQGHFHVVDVVSTVMPGSSDKEFRPLLEKTSRKTCGIDFGLVYNPEFIALGSVIKDFHHPDMILIGASDKKSSKIIESIYSNTCKNNPTIEQMNLINAEITKISINTYVTMKISFANELASICHGFKDANIDTVTKALGGDSRIGPKYLKGGMGFGGPCFPRDVIAYQRMAEDVEIRCFLPKAIKDVNDSIVPNLVERVKQKGNPEKPVLILGLSYKPDTHIIEESQSFQIAKALGESNYHVIVHDPLAMDEAKSILGSSVKYAQDLKDSMDQAGTILILTPWPEYCDFDWKDYDGYLTEKKLLVDPWRLIKSNAFKNIVVEYFGLWTR